MALNLERSPTVYCQPYHSLQNLKSKVITGVIKNIQMAPVASLYNIHTYSAIRISHLPSQAMFMTSVHGCIYSRCM